MGKRDFILKKQQQQCNCLRVKLSLVWVSVSHSQGSEQLSWWSRSPAGLAKLTPHASSWLYPSKPRYMSGIAKVMKAQQFSPLHCWPAIDSLLCLQSAAVIQYYLGTEAKQTKEEPICCICLLVIETVGAFLNTFQPCYGEMVWKLLYSTVEIAVPHLSLTAKNQVYL